MKTTENITITDGRLNRALKKRINPHVSETATKIVKESMDKSMARLGKVTKVYPYLDKAEVRLSGSKKKVLCKLPHNYMGNIIDLYTPQGENSFCQKLKEPCVIPLSPIPCILLKIHDNDSSEYFIVAYYTANDLMYISPPRHGHARLTCMTATNETYMEFGGTGFKVLSSKPIKISHGDYEKDITEVDYADAENVYTKEEVYTKKEVDALIAQKIEESLKNNEPNKGDDNGTAG